VLLPIENRYPSQGEGLDNVNEVASA